jgi:hypothetical protein
MKSMNIVRIKPKSGQKDRVIKAHNDLDLSSFDGCLSMQLVDCDDWMCGMLEWENEAHLE